MKISLAMPLLFVLAAGSAAAAPIYRCGSTYSQTPCPEGGTVVEATDPRTAAQRAEARRINAAERKAAAEQERERRAKEKAAQATPAALSATPAASAAASAPAGGKKKGKAATAVGEKDFVAAVPRK